MSVVISSYQTGRPSKVDVATAIEHLPYRKPLVCHRRAAKRLERERFNGDEILCGARRQHEARTARLADGSRHDGRAARAMAADSHRGHPALTQRSSEPRRPGAALTGRA